MNLLSVVGIRTVGGKRATLVASKHRSSSRRSQVSMGRRAKFFLLLLLSCILLVLQVYRFPMITHARLALTELTLPVVQVISQPFSALASYVSYFKSHQELLDENLKLKAQNDFLVHQHKQVHYQTTENQRLRQALNVKEILTEEVIATPVIQQMFDGMSKHYFIKLSAKDGVKKNNPVLTTQGDLCGRVVDVGIAHSYFIPITDISSRVPVQVERTNEQGVLAGDGESGLSLLHVENVNDMKVGDKLMTSGNGGIFPPGLPVAVISHVSKGVITARPIAMSRDLDFVLIITK